MALALKRTYTYLTPLDWKPTAHGMSPYQEHTDYLAKTHTVKRGGSSLLASNQPALNLQ